MKCWEKATSLLFLFLLLPSIGRTQLQGSGYGSGASHFDENAVRESFQIEALKQEIEEEMERDRMLLSETQAFANHQAATPELLTLRQEAQNRLAARSDQCFQEQMIPHIQNEFNNLCGIEDMVTLCGYGANPQEGSARQLSTSSSLDEALRQTLGQSQDTTSSAWRTTAIETNRRLHNHLKNLVNANQNCATALEKVVSPDCRGILREKFGTQYAQSRNLLKLQCSPQGIENLVISYRNYMVREDGPATVIPNCFRAHVQNRMKAIELLQALYQLNQLVEISGVRPVARPRGLGSVDE